MNTPALRCSENATELARTAALREHCRSLRSHSFDFPFSTIMSKIVKTASTPKSAIDRTAVAGGISQHTSARRTAHSVAQPRFFDKTQSSISSAPARYSPKPFVHFCPATFKTANVNYATSGRSLLSPQARHSQSLMSTRTMQSSPIFVPKCRGPFAIYFGAIIQKTSRRPPPARSHIRRVRHQVVRHWQAVEKWDWLRAACAKTRKKMACLGACPSFSTRG